MSPAFKSWGLGKLSKGRSEENTTRDVMSALRVECSSNAVLKSGGPNITSSLQGVILHVRRHAVKAMVLWIWFASAATN
jgi:hypothetical protein